MILPQKCSQNAHHEKCPRWWVHRSLFQPADLASKCHDFMGGPSFRVGHMWSFGKIRDFPWPPLMTGCMGPHVQARIIIYICLLYSMWVYLTKPQTHLFICIYIHTPKNTYPDHGFFQTKLTEYIYIYTYINHLGMIPLAFTIIPVTSLVTKNETRVPETVAFSTSSTLFCDTFGVELAKWRGNVAVLLWWRFSMIILNQISFGLSWLGATLRESWVICANIRQEGRVKRGLNP